MKRRHQVLTAGKQGSVALEILLCFEEGVSFPDSEDLKIYSVL